MVVGSPWCPRLRDPSVQSLCPSTPVPLLPVCLCVSVSAYDFLIRTPVVGLRIHPNLAGPHLTCLPLQRPHFQIKSPSRGVWALGFWEMHLTHKKNVLQTTAHPPTTFLLLLFVNKAYRDTATPICLHVTEGGSPTSTAQVGPWDRDHKA